MSKNVGELIQELKILAQTHGIDSDEVSKFIDINSHISMFKACVSLALASVGKSIIKHNGCKIKMVEDRPSPIIEERS